MTYGAALRDWRGITLIEVRVVTAILGVVLAMTTASCLDVEPNLRSRKDGCERSAGHRRGQDHLPRRHVDHEVFVTPTTTFPASGVTTGTLSTVSFEGDVDSDGTVDRLCYQVSSGVLQRKKIASGANCADTGTWESLVGGVTAFTVTFLNSSQTVAGCTGDRRHLAGPARYVDVLLTVQAAGGASTITKSIYGEVALRN